MENDARKNGCKAQIKEIAELIKKVLFQHEELLMNQYVQCFPSESEMPGLTNMSSAFSPQLSFLNEAALITNQVIFQRGFVEAAKCFLRASNHNAQQDITSSYEADGISIIKMPSTNQVIFLVLWDADEFQLLYGKNCDYFNYIASGKPTADSRELAFSYLKNKGQHSDCIFVVVNPECKYTGTGFSDEGKAYFSKCIKKVTEEISVPLSEIEISVFPFDFYFKSLRIGLPVDYFIARIEKAYATYMTVLNNIGTIMDREVPSLIARYAFASNCHVGTCYMNSDIEDVKQYFMAMPKCSQIKEPYSFTQEYKDMFQNISDKASSNLKFLEGIDVSKPLLTAEWLFGNIGKIEGFDNTFICFGYLKAVEVLLAKILVSCYNGVQMSVSSMKNIIISESSENELMLGNMIQFISSNPESALYTSPYCSLVTKAVRQWTREIRNGYFHKHTMDQTAVALVRNRTFEVIYMLLGILPR